MASVFVRSPDNNGVIGVLSAAKQPYNETVEKPKHTPLINKNSHFQKIYFWGQFQSFFSSITGLFSFYLKWTPYQGNLG